MATQQTVTVKVTPDTLKLLQAITQETGEKQYGLLKRLAEAEMQRLERQRATRPDWNRL